MRSALLALALLLSGCTLGEKRLGDVRPCPPVTVVGADPARGAEIQAAVRNGWDACGFHFGGHPERKVRLLAFYAQPIPVPKQRVGGRSYRPTGWCHHDDREAFVFLHVPEGESYPTVLAHEIAHAIAGGDRLCGESRHLRPIYAKADALDRALAASHRGEP